MIILINIMNSNKFKIAETFVGCGGTYLGFKNNGFITFYKKINILKKPNFNIRVYFSGSVNVDGYSNFYWKKEPEKFPNRIKIINLVKEEFKSEIYFINSKEDLKSSTFFKKSPKLMQLYNLSSHFGKFVNLIKVQNHIMILIFLKKVQNIKKSFNIDY